MLIHVVADFGVGDLAFAEVAQQVALRIPGAQLLPTSVPPFATLTAGFVAAQLAAAPAPEGTLLFLNVAPRRDNPAGRLDNDGERLLYAKMPSGVAVVGVDAGESFSFLAEAAQALLPLEGPTRGSQFRSRDLFPEVLARVARGELPLVGSEPNLVAPRVPAVPEGRVAYIDGFGNLKTTWRWGSLPAGLEVGVPLWVEVAGVRREAQLTDGVFAVREGALAVAPGSSGYPLVAGGAVRWVEVFLRGGSAAAAFAGVKVGDPVRLTPNG